jgi:hypothetical protein
LVAGIGMTLDAVKQNSTVKLAKGFYENLEWMKASNPHDWIVASEPGEGLFDWEVGGTGIKFHNCAYYWLQTAKHDDPHIVFINVGLSPKKLTLQEVQAEMQETENKFRADGWTPGDNNKWSKGDVEARFYSKEYEVQTYFEKPIVGPNYFEVMEMTVRGK